MSYSIFELRSWMYNQRDPETGEVTQEFLDGLQGFFYQAANQPRTMENGKILCPCMKCANKKYLDIETTKKHVFNRGFLPNYYVWYFHGEDHYNTTHHDEAGNSGSSHRVEENNYNASYNYGHHDLLGNDGGYQQGNRFHDMVTDAFHETTNFFNDNSEEVMLEEPNNEAKKFYDMLDAANQPIYEGCREGLSRLSLAARMLTIKSEDNTSENNLDKWAGVLQEYLPEDNISAGSFYEIQKLVAGLGLPYQMIDVCIDNCMIFWRDSDKLQECRFCGKPRYKPTTGRSRVPYQRMWYLPITDRLKRLYHSERTSASMRWHAEHSTHQGEMTHPSDAKAWKHFQTVHSNFAYESRNVYLGLCTDGFSPFGLSGRQYSLWPVILTPYNLPPEMCMQREFLFLTILVPGPKHPKRSLDVFLQPLIDELKQLWHSGVSTFDYSQQQNFNMRAVLLWTISDFPAYGMLSGWTTHGRLSCPHCLDRSEAFQLRHGRKPCWFDCHRRFLPINHKYRKNKELFTKNKVVRHPPPYYLSGEDLLDQIDYYGAEETCKQGGNWHSPANMPDGYSREHNWHKKSIFWELPYWKDHLLRHNLDVMHIEKNFFDNIMHTILNVAGKSKDNLKSRLDLPEICKRDALHITKDGKQPIPNFRLSADAKRALFDWVASDVKFPDGYVSKFSRCIEQGQKFSGMKSHDCHVFMQRLLPFALQELLPSHVHEAIAGIGAFFRDLCTRTLTEDGVEKLQKNIAILLCNMEKVFPPSFFDVMEHLAVHLPYEADLGGPVHFRWMYPFERFMGHLKGKAKNLAKVEGSIVQGSLTEETSNFASYYFNPNVRTRRTATKRYDDGGVAPTYRHVVPNIFKEIGRLAGKIKEASWDHKHCSAAHNYILRNLEEVHQFESIFDNLIREAYPDLQENEYEACKERDFSGWLRYYVTNGCHPEPIPLWLHEIVHEPIGKITTAPMYCTRGYVFHTYKHGMRKSTANYGIHVPGEIEFYGVLQEIIEITYPGVINLKCVLFKCDWYDPTPGRGVRRNNIGVTDVNANRRFSKFEPFILASQAEQVCFIPYPRIRQKRETWLSVIKVNPRGCVVGLDDDVAMQHDRAEEVSNPIESTENIIHVDPEHREVEDIVDDSTEEGESDDEFAEPPTDDDEREHSENSCEFENNDVENDHADE